MFNNLKFIISIFSLVIYFNFFSQIDLKLSDTLIPFKIKRKITYNPTLLANRLIEGKQTDKDKFDAIFCWVVFNIRYDHKGANSLRGTSFPRVNNILRKKRGVCLDFAFLMDTLCSIAGVQNTTITGYSKDIVFDLNDPIYVDNHAWNAVNFNGKWYLYDVTWSTGMNVWGPSKFYERILKWRSNLAKKKVLKEFKIEIKIPGNKECGIKSHKETEIRSRYRQPLFYGFLEAILQMVPYRLKLKHQKLLHQYYYLTDPEVFAITHFPDNPYWALTSRIQNIHDYSGDSLYYSLNENTYLNQHKEGRKCIDCDDYFMLNEIEKNKQMIKNSSAFNENNKFVISISYMNIADIYYNKAIKEKDSLSKMNLTDSCKVYIDLAKSELKQGLKKVRAEYLFHKQKNDSKEKMLLNTNNEHIKKFLYTNKLCKKEVPKMVSYRNKKRSYKRKYQGYQNKLKNIQNTNEYVIKKNILEDKVNTANKNLSNVIFEIDSITLLIKIYENSFLNQIEVLKNNLWNKIHSEVPIISTFFDNGILRRYYLMDNRDERIVKGQKVIQIQEKEYLTSIKEKILIPTDSSYNEFKEIYKLNNKRYDLYLKAMKSINILQQAGKTTKDSLSNFINSKRIEIQNEICWLSLNDLSITSISKAYLLFINRQTDLINSVKYENSSERIRHQQIEKEIIRSNGRHTNIVRKNINVTISMKNRLLENQKRYLEKMKEKQRRKRI